jgi:hypothetical protein
MHRIQQLFTKLFRLIRSLAWEESDKSEVIGESFLTGSARRMRAKTYRFLKWAIRSSSFRKGNSGFTGRALPGKPSANLNTSLAPEGLEYFRELGPAKLGGTLSAICSRAYGQARRQSQSGLSQRATQSRHGSITIITTEDSPPRTSCRKLLANGQT